MSMINKTTDFYNTIKIECMFLNVPNKLQCSTVVFMNVSRSEPISLTSVQPEQSLITLFTIGWLPCSFTFRMI